MGWHWHHARRLLSVEETERKIPDRLLVERILLYFSRYKRQVAVVASALLVTTISGMFQPFIITYMIDNFLNPPLGSGISVADRTTGIILVVIVLLALAIIKLASSRKQTHILSWLGQKVIYDIREDMTKRLQELSLRFYSDRMTGDIVSRVTNDVDALEETFRNMIPTLISSIISIIGYVIIMATWNTKLTLITLATLTLFIIPLTLFGRRAKRAFMRTRRGIAGVSSALEESVSGMRVIQSLTREGESQKGFGQVNIQNLRANIQAGRLFASFGTGIEIITAVATSIILWFSVAEAMAGNVSIGVIFGFTLYLTMFFQPIMQITMFFNTYQNSMASMERIVELLDTPTEILQDPESLELPPLRGEVEYRNVTFGYDPNIPILKNININVKPNETVAIVGPTGAGKSSLMNLLSRFYDPQDGCIYVDGIDIREVTLNSLRRQMGIVLQDTFLFPTTVMENIRYGRLEATDEEVFETTKRVGAHEFIERLPEGYKTEIKEGSTNVSIGQRQLISFARALLVNPRILILDEATSSVDPYTELFIQEGLQELLKDRTAFIIAHRISTVRNADKIIVLNHGEVVEEGDHDDLMVEGGLYYQLYMMQFRDSDKPLEK